MSQSFSSLGRVFDLIKKTGDRCIILSPENDGAYAIMSLPEYERLVLGKSEVAHLTEEEFLDKINRDIAVWKSQQEQEAEQGERILEKEFSSRREREIEDFYDDEWDDEDEDFDEDPYYFESVDR